MMVVTALGSGQGRERESRAHMKSEMPARCSRDGAAVGAPRLRAPGGGDGDGRDRERD